MCGPRYEEEGKLAKALESEQLLREAEEARQAHATRKEKEAAEARCVYRHLKQLLNAHS